MKSKYLSNPKPGHTTGGSGRSARRSGRAGWGKIECQQNYSPRKQRSTVPPKQSLKRLFNDSPDTRTSEILCKTKEDQNQQLTTSLSAVYHQDDKRSLFLAAEQWNDFFLVSVNPFYARHVREIIYIPSTPFEKEYFHAIKITTEKFHQANPTKPENWIRQFPDMSCMERV